MARLAIPGRPWDVAWGTVGYVAVTSSQTPITAITDLTSLTLTFTALAGRRYRITGQTLPQSTIANDTVLLSIADGANTQITRQDSGPIPSGSSPKGMNIIAHVTPGAGSITYKLRMERSGTGSVTNNATATIPSFILIEDIGPS